MIAQEPVWREFLRAPLVPVAVAATVGLLADRYVGVPFGIGLGACALGLVGWMTTRLRGRASVFLLWAAFAGLASAYHHHHCNYYPADDVGEFAGENPKLVRVRAVLIDDPIMRKTPKGDQPFAGARTDRDAVDIEMRSLETRDGEWIPVSGYARLTVERDPAEGSLPPLAGMTAGDAVEFVGMLSRPRPPMNPGERDYRESLKNRRFRAELYVADSSAGVVRLEPGTASASGAIAALRRHAVRGLDETMEPREAATARALLLGDGSAMDREEWDIYIRTGVVHALAISGQHLAVLAGFLWFALRLFGVRRDRAAAVVLVVIVGYTVLTGLRPSGVRAAIMVSAVCGGLILRRSSSPANSFALGWLAVILFNPTDPFTLGCQLSFLSVFVLVWGVSRWLKTDPPDAIEKLEAKQRSTLENLIRGSIRLFMHAYAITLVLGAVNAPLILADQNVVSPVGWLLGPLVVVLTSIALISGFLLIALAPLGPVAVPFALVTEWSLELCRGLVRLADEVPGGSLYLPGPPTWWLVLF